MSLKRRRLEIPRLRTLQEIADRTGIPRSTWYTLVARGEIETVRYGRAVRVSEAEVIRWIDAHRERAS